MTILNKIIHYFLYLLFLAVSGGSYFYIRNGRYFVIMFLLSSIVLHVKRNKRFSINENSYFLIGVVLYQCINYFLLNINHSGNTFLPQLLLFIGTYFFMSSFSVSEFKRYYLNSVTIMTGISLLIFVGYMNNLLPITVEWKDNRAIQFCFYHSVVGNRLSGIYWEPGVMQIPLNMTLLLYIKELFYGRIEKNDIWKFAIIIFAVIMTISTAGILWLCLFMTYFAFRRVVRKRISVKIALLIVALFGGAITIYLSDIVQDKLQMRTDSTASSMEIRKSDNLAMLVLISEKPMCGWGIDSKEMERRNAELNNLTNSNGILALTSQFGILFFVFWSYHLIKKIRRYYNNEMVIGALLLFFFLNAFEVYWYFPVALIFHFCVIGNDVHNSVMS